MTSVREQIDWVARSHGWAAAPIKEPWRQANYTYRRSHRAGPRAWTEAIDVQYNRSGAIMQAAYRSSVGQGALPVQCPQGRRPSEQVLEWLKRWPAVAPNK